jgi:general transcription factor 3C polypeptide 3 (transcription factor C subunit 4)
VGRAYHQLGLVHQAVKYYEEVLKQPLSEEENCNLKREAAFNLSLIYKASGNMDMARNVLREFCTV